MATFLDETPQFNPYVSQIDTNAALQVGLQKQAQYNEGVQRIQSQIDSVAGIELSRDVDKQYLQSKLNDLSSDLKTVSVGDFSNFQLVNSVGGMVNKIAKDKTIQTAYASTQNDKKQLAKIEKDVEEGKNNPANTYYYQKQREAWLNSPIPGESFNGQYVPAFDVFKHAKEVFEEVKPDGYSLDQIYVTDAMGKPVTDRNGKPVLSPHMARLEKEGRFPEKVRETIDYIFSDPRVDTQLSISGQYNLRQASPEYLQATVNRQESMLVGSLNERLNALNLDKNSGKNVDAEIDQVKLQIENIKSKYSEYSTLAITNPDAVRGMIHKDQVKSNYSTIFGWSKTKETLHDNPSWNAVFKMNQEANRVSQWEQEMRLNRDKFEFDKGYKMTTLALKQKELENKFGSTKLWEQDFQPTDTQSYVEQFDRTVEVASENYATSSDDLVYKMVLESPETSAKFQEYKRAGNTDAQAAHYIMRDKVRENLRIKGIPNPTDVQIDEALNEQKTVWQTEAVAKLETLDPNTLSSRNKLLLQNYTNAKQEYDNVMSMKEQYEQTLGPEVISVLNSEKVKNLTKPTVIEVEGNPVNISAQDMHDAAIYRNGKGPFKTREAKKLAENAKNRLISKGYDFLLDYVDSRNTSNPTGFSNIRQQTAYKSKGFDETFNKVTESIDNAEIQSAIKAKEDVLKQLNFSVSPQLKTNVLTGNAEDDRNTRQNVARLLGNYQSNSQNLDPGFKGNVSEMLALMKKNENLGIELKADKDDVIGTITPRIVFYDNNGKPAGSVIITPEEATSVFGIDTNTIYQSKKITGIQNRMNFNPNNRTSIGNPEITDTYTSGSSDYIYSTSDFKALNGVGNVQVKANIAQYNGRYIPYIYVYDGKTEKVVDLGDYGSLAEVVNKLDNVNSSLVNSILKEK